MADKLRGCVPPMHRCVRFNYTQQIKKPLVNSPSPEFPNLSVEDRNEFWLIDQVDVLVGPGGESYTPIYLSRLIKKTA